MRAFLCYCRFIRWRL